jgi:hypothetical protein
MVAVTWASGDAPARSVAAWIRDRFWETVLVGGAVVYLAVVGFLLAGDLRTAHDCRDRGGHQAADPVTHQVRCVVPGR